MKFLLLDCKESFGQIFLKLIKIAQIFQLVIGNPGINEGMSRVQMSVWSIWSAPLIMSNDLRSIRPELRAILQNTRVINVDQDPLGRFGRMVLKVKKILMNEWFKNKF